VELFKKHTILLDETKVAERAPAIAFAFWKPEAVGSSPTVVY
jgi:hypothetical protein